MKFSFQCVRNKSKLQEDFYFDSETPSGHFFAVLDFAAHDYANLNASLKGKLETVVSSFVSVSSFSADLFLRFLAKEINNFAHNLAKQSGGPDLLCSAALCLVSGSRLSYFISGDTTISILKGGRLLTLEADPIAEKEEKKVATQLGANYLETPISGQVHDLTLQDVDVVVIMTRGLAETIKSHQLPNELMNVREPDTKLICDSLMKTGAADLEDGALVVIGGPYEREVEPALAELSEAVALLEEKLNALTEREAGKLDATPPVETAAVQFEERLSQQITELQGDLARKAATVDLLELNERVKKLSELLAAKADTTEVLGLQRDVLKLGLVSNVAALSEPNETVAETVPPVPPETSGPSVDSSGSTLPDLIQSSPPVTPFTLKTALIILAVSLAAGFVGGWLGLRLNQQAQEVWSVKTAGNQISISRQDGMNDGVVTLTVAQPLKSRGEQKFSSFADVKRYVDTITSVEAPLPEASQTLQPTSPVDGQAAAATTEITVKPGDSLKKLAEQYDVPPERLMELNPAITRWPLIQIGQKIIVPAPNPAPAPSSPSAPADQSRKDDSAGDTTEVILGRGDSLNELARRFNTTAERLKELNPQISNWARIQPGQKVLVPSPTG